MTLMIDQDSAKTGLIVGGWYNALLAKPSNESHQLEIEPIFSEIDLLDGALLMAKSVRTNRPALVIHGIKQACEIKVFACGSSAEVGSKKIGTFITSTIIDLLRLDRVSPAGSSFKLQIIPAH